MEHQKEKAPYDWQMRLHEVIYESEKPAGKIFDVVLLACILVSIFVVMLDSVLGKFIASFIMLLGYGIIAVPTGIVTTEMALAAKRREQTNQACPSCGREGHDRDAKHCKYCGAAL